MILSRHDSFRPIGQILASDVLPALCRAQKLPLRISCLGVVSYGASSRLGDDADSFDRMIPLKRNYPLFAGALKPIKGLEAADD